MGWFKAGDDGFAMFLAEGFFWFENGGSFLSQSFFLGLRNWVLLRVLRGFLHRE